MSSRRADLRWTVLAWETLCAFVGFLMTALGAMVVVGLVLDVERMSLIQRTIGLIGSCFGAKLCFDYARHQSAIIARTSAFSVDEHGVALRELGLVSWSAIESVFVLGIGLVLVVNGREYLVRSSMLLRRDEMLAKVTDGVARAGGRVTVR